jgi:hypothetical protein
LGNAGGFAHVVCQALPQEEPRPLHARLDRAQLDMQCLGDLGIREPFDIVQEKGRAEILRQLVNGATEHRFELTFDRRVLQSPRPVDRQRRKH